MRTSVIRDRSEETSTTMVGQRWDEETDIVVVGFGAAGASAALEAAQNGARVVVLDRYHGGGATAASGGVIYSGGGTPHQQAVGYDDTPEEMYRYLKKEVGDVVSDATLRRFCEASPSDLAWLEEAGVPFEASLCPFKTSYPTDDYYLYFSGNEQVSRCTAQAKPAPRGHRAKGPGISGLALFRALERAVQGQGIRVRCQNQVRGLVFSTDSQVIGVEGRSIAPNSGWALLHRRLSKINAKATTYVPKIAKHVTTALERIMDCYSHPFRVRARKGIILAAGGCIFNPEMSKKMRLSFCAACRWALRGTMALASTWERALAGASPTWTASRSGVSTFLPVC